MEPRPKTIPFGASATTTKPKTIPFGVASSVPTAPEKPKEQGFLETLIRDPLETLLVKPADRFAETIGRTGILGQDIKRGYEEMADKGENRNLFGFDVDAQRGFGQGGAKQIAGEGLKTLSYLYAGGAAPAAVKTTLGGAAKEGAIRLGTTGALTGGAYGAGEEMTQEDSTLGSILGGGAGGAALGAITGGALGAAAPAVVKAISPAQRAIKRADEAKEAIRRVAQGSGAKGTTAADQEITARALREIDIDGVKTNADLEARIDEKVGDISSELDKVLETDPTRRTAAQLEHQIDVNGQKVRKNYVMESLDQLESEYTKTNNLQGATLIRQIREKAQKEGLTVKEINDIARIHGRDLNAFNLNGQLSSGLTKQTAENTRSGLKTTSRTMFGNKIAQEADKTLSDLLRTKKLISDRAEAVERLKASIVDPTILQRLGGLLEQVINIGTLGSSRALMKTALQGAGKAETKLDALGLEKRLAKDLKIIAEAMEDGASEQTIMQKLKEFLENNGEVLFLGPGRAPESKPLFSTPGGKNTPNWQEAIDVTAVETGRAPTPTTDRRLGSYLQKKDAAMLDPVYTPPNELPVIKAGRIPKKPKNLSDIF